MHAWDSKICSLSAKVNSRAVGVELPYPVVQCALEGTSLCVSSAPLTGSSLSPCPPAPSNGSCPSFGLPVPLNDSCPPACRLAISTCFCPSFGLPAPSNGFSSCHPALLTDCCPFSCHPFPLNGCPSACHLAPLNS